MRRRVDAAGQARDDRQALLPKVARQAPGEAAGGRRGVAGANDRHRLPLEQGEIALGDQQGGRRRQLGQQGGIKPLPKRQVARAKLFDPVDFLARHCLRSDRRRPAAAARGKIGDRGQRRLGAAETGDQLAERNGPNRLRADQPDAG